jgi:hypothetical protein
MGHPLVCWYLLPMKKEVLKKIPVEYQRKKHLEIEQNSNEFFVSLTTQLGN